MDRRQFLGGSLVALAYAGSLGMGAARAASRTGKGVIVGAKESLGVSLDIQVPGAPVASEAAWNAYDRLITHPKIDLGGGQYLYDSSKFIGELAESFEQDGGGITFQLRKTATFHDGRPVTAADVKWSFDRAVSGGGFATTQMKAGSMENPAQFVVLDDHTFRIDLPREDKLTLLDLVVPVAQVMNSELIKEHATADDPWGFEWTRTNEAGGGAFKVVEFQPGESLTLERFDEWTSGPLPETDRFIMRQVSGASNRRALVERGDVDVMLNLPPKDYNELKASGAAKVVGAPEIQSVWSLDMLVTKAPFDDVRVRQAVAWAISYGELLSLAFLDRGIPLSGGSSTQVTEAKWPQPHWYYEDLEKAKALLAAAGHADGFTTTLNYDAGQATVAEPMAVVIQQSLARIGITVQLDKVPSANWDALTLEKTMPMLINQFNAWIDAPEYFFLWTYHGQNALYNTMSYKNPELDALVEQARFEHDPAKYAELVKGFVQIAFDEVPRIPLVQPMQDSAVASNVDGFTTWFTKTLDARPLTKSS